MVGGSGGGGNEWWGGSGGGGNEWWGGSGGGGGSGGEGVVVLGAAKEAVVMFVWLSVLGKICTTDSSQTNKHNKPFHCCYVNTITMFNGKYVCSCIAHVRWNPPALQVLSVDEETCLLLWISMIFSVALTLNFAFLPRKLIVSHGQGFRVSTYL